MRLLFLLPALFTVSTAFAQSPGQPRLQKPKAPSQQQSIAAESLTYPQTSILSGKTYSFTLPNGTKVHQLPQDNMPCVAPDLTQSSMPNAGSPEMIRKKINRIPDPSRPVLMILPEKKKPVQ